MSEPTGARRYGVGGGDAYYDAVRYGGYEGTREQFGKDQAEFAQNAAVVAEAKETVERDTEEVRNTKNTFENTTVPEAIRALEQESEDQILAITQKGEEVSQQVETVGTEQKDAVANEGRARVQAVEQAGTTQVQAVNDAGTTQVGNVNQAGEDQVDAVEQAGADQVQAVTDEGTTQVQRVQDKGDEVIEHIPADYTALDQEVDNLKESLQNNTLILPIEFETGYIDGTGTIHIPSANAEKTTNFIPVNYLDVFHIDYTLPEERSMWVTYAFYDADKVNIGGRPAIVSNVLGTNRSANIVITNENVKYLRISFRTFGYNANEIFSIYHPVTEQLHTLAIGNEANIFEDSISGVYLNASSGYAYNYFAFLRYKLFEIDATSGDVFNIIYNVNIPTGGIGADLFYTFFNEDIALGGRSAVRIDGTGEFTRVVSITAPANTTKLKISAMFYDNAILSVYKNGILVVPTISFNDLGYIQNMVERMKYKNPNIKSINHRGYNSFAPENTIPAFVLSKKCGFEYVESDVRFTSDGVAVMLHDDSINRTARNADGTEIANTINIADITYEEALTYDFGIWKGQAYAGTKIPTLDEFLDMCKRIGLKPYIELKVGTEAQIQSIVDRVYRYGMQDYTTYIGYSLLTYVKDYDEKARLGYICNTITSTVVDAATALRTNKNEVFINSANGIGEALESAIANRFPIEMWQGYTYHEYVSGYTSNDVIYGDIFGYELI